MTSTKAAVVSAAATAATTTAAATMATPSIANHTFTNITPALAPSPAAVPNSAHVPSPNSAPAVATAAPLRYASRRRALAARDWLQRLVAKRYSCHQDDRHDHDHDLQQPADQLPVLADTKNSTGSSSSSSSWCDSARVQLLQRQLTELQRLYRQQAKLNRSTVRKHTLCTVNDAAATHGEDLCSSPKRGRWRVENSALSPHSSSLALSSAGRTISVSSISDLRQSSPSFAESRFPTTPVTVHNKDYDPKIIDHSREYARDYSDSHYHSDLHSRRKNRDNKCEDYNSNGHDNKSSCDYGLGKYRDRPSDRPGDRDSYFDGIKNRYHSHHNRSDNDHGSDFSDRHRDCHDRSHSFSDAKRDCSHNSDYSDRDCDTSAASDVAKVSDAKAAGCSGRRGNSDGDANTLQFPFFRNHCQSERTVQLVQKLAAHYKQRLGVKSQSIKRKNGPKLRIEMDDEEEDRDEMVVVGSEEQQEEKAARADSGTLLAGKRRRTVSGADGRGRTDATTVATAASSPVHSPPVCPALSRTRVKPQLKADAVLDVSYGRRADTESTRHRPLINSIGSVRLRATSPFNTANHKPVRTNRDSVKGDDDSLGGGCGAGGGDGRIGGVNDGGGNGRGGRVERFGGRGVRAVGSRGDGRSRGGGEDFGGRRLGGRGCGFGGGRGGIENGRGGGDDGCGVGGRGVRGGCSRGGGGDLAKVNTTIGSDCGGKVTTSAVTKSPHRSSASKSTESGRSAHTSPAHPSAGCWPRCDPVTSADLAADRLSGSQQLQLLVCVDGLFYRSRVQPLQPPDIYGVSLLGDRQHRPAVYTHEQLLRQTVREVSPVSMAQLVPGTRVLANWSPKLRGLFPGTVSEDPRKGSCSIPASMLYVEFDDGDAGYMRFEGIRLLPVNYPTVERDDDPLDTLFCRRRRVSASTSSGSHSHSVSASAGVSTTTTTTTAATTGTTATASSSVCVAEQLAPSGGVVRKQRGRPKRHASADESGRTLMLSTAANWSAPNLSAFPASSSSSPPPAPPPPRHLSSTVEAGDVISGGGGGGGGDVTSCATSSSSSSNSNNNTRRARTFTGDVIVTSQSTTDTSTAATTTTAATTAAATTAAATTAAATTAAATTATTAATTAATTTATATAAVSDGNANDNSDCDSSSSESDSSSSSDGDSDEWRWVGRGVKRPASKAKSKRCEFNAVQRRNEVYNVGDCAVFVSVDGSGEPYVGRIEALWQTPAGRMLVRVAWFYRPHETVGCRQRHLYNSGALFRSPHTDTNCVQSISHSCLVLASAADYQRHLHDDQHNYNTIDNKANSGNNNNNNNNSSSSSSRANTLAATTTTAAADMAKSSAAAAAAAAAKPLTQRVFYEAGFYDPRHQRFVYKEN